ncbi:MAG: proton-conducting transporter membrane subunit [Candidatus Marinimicrobia bacterium]|nr:proton-conducting transporter membrane subunit [Candidatus Neomarinimicrobiota bacterium]
MILPFFIIIPLLTAFLIAIVAGKKDNFANGLSIFSALLLLLGAIYNFFTQNQEVIVYKIGNWDAPIGINLVQDSLTIFMLIIVGLISLTSIIYSRQYIRNISTNWKYYALFMFMVTGMNGVIITGDLFNLFVFMEIALLSTYALVAYGGKAEEFEASFKYAIMGIVSSTFILVGIAITYSATSTLTLAKIAEQIPHINTKIVYLVSGIFLMGFGLKAAIIPFHTWLPDAHSSAPAPISAMLSGVLIKALGIYVLIRIVYNILGAPELFLKILLILGAVSIIIGVLLALAQWDMKRLLAYHSISQIGYIVLAMGIATPLGIIGAVYHLLNHALFKSLLFYNAGAVEMGLGTRNLKRMGNLTKIMPVASQTSMVASLSIAGIPPFNGFFSKIVIIIAAVQADKPIFAFVAVLGSILTLASFMKVQRYGFRAERMINKLRHRIGWGMNVAMITIAFLCLATSLLIIPGIREFTLDPIMSVIMNKTNYIQMVLGR